MNGTLKLEPKSGNSYKQLYQTLQTNPLFDQAAWEQSAREGRLPEYSYLLQNTDKIADINKFKDTYHYDFADATNKIAALNNELFPDMTVEKHPRYLQDEQGNYLKDDKGKYLTEDYEISNYDYYKNAIIENNIQREQDFKLKQEQEAKDSMNGFVKFIHGLPSFAGELLSGAINHFENVAKVASGLFYAGYRAINGQERFDDAFVKFLDVAIDEKAGLVGKDLQDAVIDFERKYSYMRDVDGQYTNIGQVFGGLATTLGQMIPSMIIPSFGTGGIAKNLRSIVGTGGIAKNLRSIVGTGVFYTGVTAEDIKANYDYLSKQKSTVPTWQIITNSVTKSTLQAIEEQVLGNMFGTSAIDRMLKGKGKIKLQTGNIYSNALNRFFSEAIEEGLEEVVQDTSNFLVDKAFQYLIHSDFGTLTNEDGTSVISWESLMDSFIMAVLASIAGSSFQILTTKREGVPKLDKDGKVVRDDKGNIVYKKLSKLSSWEYGLDMQSFVDNFNKVIELGKKNNYYMSDSKAGKEYADAFKNMYASYRILSSLYGEIGETRFSNANKILNFITEYTKAGLFDTKYLTQQANEIANEIVSLRSMYKIDKAKQKIVDKLKKAGIAEQQFVVNRDDDLSVLKVDENVKKKLDVLFKSDSSLEKVIVTKHGTNFVSFGNVKVLPINTFKNINAIDILPNEAEQDLVHYIITGDYRGFDVDQIKDLFVLFTNNKDATVEEAVYNMLYNKEFINELLFTNDKEMHKFISSLRRIIETKDTKTFSKVNM